MLTARCKMPKCKNPEPMSRNQSPLATRPGLSAQFAKIDEPT